MFKKPSPVIESAIKLPGRLQVRAWGAGPYIKSTLLIRGSVSVSYENTEGVTKSLIHYRALRPSHNAIWPLSLVQAHEVSFIIEHKTDNIRKIVEQRYYKRYLIDKAISHLLSGIPDDAEIIIDISDVETPFFPNFEPFVGLICGIVSTLFAVLAPIVVAGYNIYTNQWALIAYMVLALISGYILSYLSWAPFEFFKQKLFSNKTSTRYVTNALLVLPLLASTYLHTSTLYEVGIDSPHKISLVLVSAWVASIPLVKFKMHYENFTEGKHALNAFHGLLLAAMVLTSYGIIGGHLNSYFEVLSIHALVIVISNYFGQSALNMQYFGREAGWIKD